MGTFSFEPCEDGIRLTAWSGPETELEIPETIDGKKVRVLGTMMFFEKGSHLTRLWLPESIRIIEADALEGCADLEDLILNEGLISLGREFAGMCSLKEVRIPASVSMIDEVSSLDFRLQFEPGGSYWTDGFGIYHKTAEGIVFAGIQPGDERISYAIQEGTVKIERRALDRRNDLQSLSLPATLKEIAPGSLFATGDGFAKRRGIRDFSIAAGNSFFAVQDSMLYQKNEAGKTLLAYTGEEKEITLDDSFEAIERLSFFRAPVHQVIFPEARIRIAENAFLDCELEEAVFPGFHILFPKHHEMLRQELLACFGRNGTLFDWNRYDRAMKVSFLSAERVRLLSARLRWPEGLSETFRASFFQLLSEKLEEACALADEADDSDSILRLAECGLITRENLDDCLQHMISGIPGPSAALLAWSASHLPSDSDDFSL